MDATRTVTGNCAHCGGALAIRNPTGKCDHLYYPENCDLCFARVGGRTIFYLWTYDDLLGIYSTIEKAEAAKARLLASRGWNDTEVAIMHTKLDSDAMWNERAGV
jgi:hypothetical protein